MQCDDPDTLSDSALAEKLRLWVYLKAQVDRNTAQLNQLRDQISADVERYGRPDESGHVRMQLRRPFEYGGKRYEGIKRERRVSRTLSQDRAEALANARGLRDRLFPMRPVFDADELLVLYQQGLLTEGEIDGLYDTKITWAFKPEADPL